MNFFVGERCGQGTTCLVPCAHFPRQPTSYKRKIWEVLLVLATIAVELLDTCSARLIGAEYSRLFPGVNLHKPRLQNTVDIHLHSLSLPLSQDAVGMQGPPYRGDRGILCLYSSVFFIWHRFYEIWTGSTVIVWSTEVEEVRQDVTVVDATLVSKHFF